MTIARMAKSLLMAGVMTMAAGTPGRTAAIDVPVRTTGRRTAEDGRLHPAGPRRGH